MRTVRLVARSNDGDDLVLGLSIVNAIATPTALRCRYVIRPTVDVPSRYDSRRCLIGKPIRTLDRSGPLGRQPRDELHQRLDLRLS